jgi:hypothetical protein
MKSPFNYEITERVEPQDGQGIFVTYFIRQNSADILPAVFLDALK